MSRFKTIVESCAHVAASVSALISVAAIAFAWFQYNSAEEAKQTENWQKVVVYNYILKHPESNFDDIKANYVANAGQLQTFKLDGNDIQDDALRKVILDLQASNLIQLIPDKRYQPVVVKDSAISTLMFEWLKDEYKNRSSYVNYSLIHRTVMDVLKGNCGKYTQDQLWRKVKVATDVGDDTFHEILQQMRPYVVLLLDDFTYCLNFDAKVAAEVTEK
ncbi:hypothetical protein [Vibrio rotiferianus]|uniref:hypothetical protein n=1 Tax=Vibrio rotiferianus TaxID=190895 RepID=UPI00111037CA|nr:hypothetical protein [Vibrio rotiferianus]TMX70269.1 hypothetical protein DA097_05265 [Vibrio rotiferianus]